MFSQRFSKPQALPPQTLDTFLELIRNPKRVEELWEAYKLKEKEYRALVASEEAYRADVEKYAAQVQKQEAELAAKLKDFTRQVQAYETERHTWEQAKAQWLENRTKTEADLVARETAVAGRLDAAAKQEALIADKQSQVLAYEAAVAKAALEKNKELDKREAAIAAREVIVEEFMSRFKKA